MVRNPFHIHMHFTFRIKAIFVCLPTYSVQKVPEEIKNTVYLQECVGNYLYVHTDEENQ